MSKKHPKKFLVIGATALLAVIKLLFFIQKAIGFLLVYLIYKPARICLRFVFYKAVVRFYSYYLSFFKRLGWIKPKEGFFAFLLNQKLVHILVAVIALFLILVNITTKTEAGDYTDLAHRTILADLIKGEFSEFEEDEQFIIESFDTEVAISATQQSYLDSLSVMKPQPKASIKAAGEEKETEEVARTIHGGASIVKPDIASTMITKRSRKGTITYIVKPGDSVSTIAEEFAISVSTILWENSLNAWSIIRPGDKLIILPFSGLTHKVVQGENLSGIAKKYKIDEEKILTANNLADISVLQVGQSLFIPGGKKKIYASNSSSRYTGLSAIRDMVKAPDAKPAAGNKMNWPTAGRRITQYYSWRHHAVDIANKTGTPIYAADAGTIESLGWGKGYGNQIVINHGGGKKTRYAHLSKFYVQKGHKVSKGETIAAMGSTGWSTGPHLHFEVIINGRKYNPLNYIK